MVGVLVVMVVLVCVAAGWLNQARVNRRVILRQFVPLLDRSEMTGTALGDTVSGSRGGRAVTLELRVVPWTLGGNRYPVRAELELHNAPEVRVRVRVDRGLAAVEKALGRADDVEVAGGGNFDRRYLVETDEDVPDQGGLADEEVRRAIDTLLSRWQLDEVRIEAGRLFAYGASPLLSKMMLVDLLVTLELLAHAYDRRPVPIVRSRPSFAWVGGPDAEARCPFCHDVLGDVDVAACDGCATLIHAECHAENGGCPILGCGARSVDRIGPIPFEA